MGGTNELNFVTCVSGKIDTAFYKLTRTWEIICLKFKNLEFSVIFTKDDILLLLVKSKSDRLPRPKSPENGRFDHLPKRT